MKGLVLGAGVTLAVLGVWIAWDLAGSRRHSLRHFDGHQVGRLETAMWRSYYDHRSVRLFGELVQLLREQYHLRFWQSCAGAFHAARSAVVFQKGHNRSEYERALPDLVKYYRLIRRASDEDFQVDRVARLELEWWIVHRERSQRPRADLDRALAELQVAIYREPAERFEPHAKARAEAMLLRDTSAEAGGVTERDWARIGELLDASWVSLAGVVAR